MLLAMVGLQPPFPEKAKKDIGLDASGDLHVSVTSPIPFSDLRVRFVCASEINNLQNLPCMKGEGGWGAPNSTV